MRALPSIQAAEDGETMRHQPVLVSETLELLRLAPGSIVVDGTIGPAGHAERIAEAIAPAGRLIGIDRDPAELSLAAERLDRFSDRIVLGKSDFREIRRIVERFSAGKVDAILADLG